jgi:hypothetical protein
MSTSSETTRDLTAPDPRSPSSAGAYGRTVLVLLGLYVLSRLVTTLFLVVAEVLASTGHWPYAHDQGGSGFAGFLQSWDGLLYREISLHGYPSILPLTVTGEVDKNAWAFLPVYPLIVRALMGALGGSFALVGVLVSIVAGAGATLALHGVLRERFDERSAFWGALFFCFGPLSFVLQITYAESTYLLLMFCGLLALLRRSYLLMIPFGVVAAFTHPGALALAAALGISLLGAILRTRRLALRENARAWIALAATTAAGLAWPFVAAAATGVPSAYVATETAWWRDYIGQVHFVPLTPWFLLASHYLGPAGVGLVVLVIGMITWLLVVRSRGVGSVLLSYAASYTAYLVAVFLPQQSIFRMLLPLSPLLGQPALSRTPARARATLAVCILLQPAAILLLWVTWPP